MLSNNISLRFSLFYENPFLRENLLVLYENTNSSVKAKYSGILREHLLDFYKKILQAFYDKYSAPSKIMDYLIFYCLTKQKKLPIIDEKSCMNIYSGLL